MSALAPYLPALVEARALRSRRTRPPTRRRSAFGRGCLLGGVGLALAGLGLMLHFGVFNDLAGLCRLAGVDARPLFRAPGGTFAGRLLASALEPCLFRDDRAEHLVLPLPILFHWPFLRRVVWPLIGLQ